MTTYRFDGFTLAPAARELQHEGVVVALPARAFDCLTYLVEHRDRAVGRDELIAAVWGRVEISDALLNHTIVKLRRSLGDTGNEQRTIRTVPRFGYRWVLDVRDDDVALAVEAPPPGDAQADPAPMPPEKPRRGLAAIAAIGMAVACTLAWFAWHASVSRRPPPPPSEAVWVMPAEVEAGMEWRWLRLGTMDLVSNRLRGGGLPALSSESVLTLLRAHPGDGERSFAAPVAATSLRVQPRLRQRDGHWKVRLDAIDAQGARSVEASDADPIAAAREAADALLRLYGHVPNAVGFVQAPAAVEEVLEQSGAAMLADHLDEARALIAATPESVRTTAQVQQRLAQLDLRSGDYAAVTTRLDALLDALPKGRDDALRSRAMLTLAAAFVRTRATERAADLYDEVIALRKDTSDREPVGIALLGQGALLASHGRYDAATDALSNARTELAAVGDGVGMASIDVNLGEFQLSRHRPAAALPILGDALREFERLGAREGRAYALARLVDADVELLDGAGALAASERFWPAAEATRNAAMLRSLSLARASALALASRGDEAQALLEGIHADADPHRDALVRAQAAWQLARLALLRGERDAGRASLDEALLPVLRDSDPVAWSRALLLKMSLEDADAVATDLDTLRAAQPPAGDEWGAMQVAFGEAWLARAQHRDADALAAFAKAMRGAESFGVPEDLVAVGAPYVAALIAAGQLDAARQVAGRISQWADRDPRAAMAQAQLFRAVGQLDAARLAEERVRRLTGRAAAPKP